MLHSSGVMLRMMQATGASLVMPIYDSFRTWRRGRDDDTEGLDGYIKVGRDVDGDDHDVSLIVNLLRYFQNKHTYAQYLEAMGLPAGSAQLFTAHQMCSCRMADSPSQVCRSHQLVSSIQTDRTRSNRRRLNYCPTQHTQGPVDERGELFETPGLFVMDASVFPTSLGACVATTFY